MSQLTWNWKACEIKITIENDQRQIQITFLRSLHTLKRWQHIVWANGKKDLWALLRTTIELAQTITASSERYFDMFKIMLMHIVTNVFTIRHTNSTWHKAVCCYCLHWTQLHWMAKGPIYSSVPLLPRLHTTPLDGWRSIIQQCAATAMTAHDSTGWPNVRYTAVCRYCQDFTRCHWMAVGTIYSSVPLLHTLHTTPL